VGAPHPPARGKEGTSAPGKAGGRKEGASLVSKSSPEGGGTKTRDSQKTLGRTTPQEKEFCPAQGGGGTEKKKIRTYYLGGLTVEKHVL